VAAFAPVTDVPAWLAEPAASFESVFPGYKVFIEQSSPDRYGPELSKKPVFLFHASDDSVVSPSETEHLMTSMQPAHPSSKRKVVTTGGHYDSMINEGIPSAIEWFNALSRNSVN
jgi:predicted esterase